MPKDCVGNELAEGQLVTLFMRPEENHPIGTITKIQESKIMDPKNPNKVMPGMVKVVVEYTLTFHPQLPLIPGVARVVNPRSEQVLAGAMPPDMLEPPPEPELDPTKKTSGIIIPFSAKQD